ncbi:MAG: hypothetical protein K1X53_00935 [Candidatus Sumerlaeaceae bacterium]|nr:hypothetical protein [Candidatus Sumerlaeaceae bacterium]
METVFENHAEQVLEELMSIPGFKPADLPSLLSKLENGERISPQLADFLLAANAVMRTSTNSEAWNRIYVDTLTTYYLGGHDSPLRLTPAEAAHLIAEQSADGRMDKGEVELLVRLAAVAESSPEEFKEFLMNALRQRIVSERHISGHSVNLVSQMIFGPGGYMGSRISPEEAEFLFDLNLRLANRENDPSWSDFYVGALWWFLIHDDKSPKVVAHAEAGWLMDNLSHLRTLDANNRTLFRKLRTSGISMPSYLSKRLEELDPGV